VTSKWPTDTSSGGVGGVGTHRHLVVLVASTQLTHMLVASLDWCQDKVSGGVGTDPNDWWCRDKHSTDSYCETDTDPGRQSWCGGRRRHWQAPAEDSCSESVEAAPPLLDPG
jgi:hypothetical protein